jgi:hypothetical protein
VNEHQLELLTFLVLIFPSFLFYAGVYHRGEDDRSNEIESVRENLDKFRTYWIVLVLLLAAFVSFWIMYNGTKEGGQESVPIPLLLPTVIGVLPFLFWPNWLHYNIRRGNGEFLWFRNRTLFPGLLTTSVPLVFGWCVPSQLSGNGWLVIGGVGATVLLLWGLSLLDKTAARFQRVAAIGLVVLFCVVLGSASIFPLSMSEMPWQIFGVVFFAFMLSLLLGVLEASCVCSRVQHNKQLVPPINEKRENSVEIKKEYELGTNKAFCFILPLFLATAIHPAASFLYTVLVLIAILLSICIWIGGTRVDCYKRANCFGGRAVGFLILLAVIIGVSFGKEFSLGGSGFLRTVVLSQLLAPLALLVFSVKLVKESEKATCFIGMLLGRRLKAITFMDKGRCLDVSIVIAGLLAVLAFAIWIVAQLRDPLPVASVQQPAVIMHGNSSLLLLLILVLYQIIAWIATRYIHARKHCSEGIDGGIQGEY